ncbi:deoxyribodipyrimidine photo-lyase [Sphingobacterium sp. HMA12]|uniref:cryptochrome/photolyase family protein n=1 Tax=Sphingobacterium sp. HMA12 TaxID=2050894 RepID=UPI000CEA6B39|nr:deoxyribodipyrimidine photo-lyase [Sphingobacterium sp. HMA12]
MEESKIVVFWFRRDLRLEDNAGLSRALATGVPVLPVFIFDEDILQQLEDKSDRRVDYIHQALTGINKELKGVGATLNTFYGSPLAIFKTLHEKYRIHEIYCNRDYEPKAIQRDRSIFEFFKTAGIPFKAIKDQVIFDKNELLKNDGTPYTVYTPYAKKWRAKLTSRDDQPLDYKGGCFVQQAYNQIITLEKIGFKKTDFTFEPPQLSAHIIDSYDKYRDYPALAGTTNLGIALRFGTISIRQCVAFARRHNEVWLSELIWREFFMQILYHFPNVVSGSFKKKYDGIQWRNNEAEFERWCKGETGYPLVDAGMRQLNSTGYMHNRVRMVAASFLCKHLLIDWRWGEAYFAQKLNDYDLSANNGNWQWAAGCGCDAAPYFRVFNPIIQAEKFDKKQEYSRQWIPELGSTTYPEPMIAHSFARERALKTYTAALG